VPQPTAAASASCRTRWTVALAASVGMLPRQLCVPQGASVTVSFRSADGHVHEVAIAGYGQVAAAPANGEPVTIHFTADAPGRFPVVDPLLASAAPLGYLQVLPPASR